MLEDLVLPINGGKELKLEANIHGLLILEFLCMLFLVILPLDIQLFQTPLEITYIIFLITDIELAVLKIPDHLFKPIVKLNYNS